MKRVQTAVVVLGTVACLAAFAAFRQYPDVGFVAALVALALFGWSLPIVACFRKGKGWLGYLGIIYPPFAVAGACRIAHPDSEYAQENYGPNSVKMRRAQQRFGTLHEPQIQQYLDQQRRLASAQ